MNLHYSLFTATTFDGESVVIDLSQVRAIQSGGDRHVVYVTLSDSPSQLWLEPDDQSSLISAWNRYKYAAAAAQLIKIPEQANPTVACNSAMRIDEYLGFLAGEKLKELAELAGEKSA